MEKKKTNNKIAVTKVMLIMPVILVFKSISDNINTKQMSGEPNLFCAIIIIIIIIIYNAKMSPIFQIASV